MIYSVKHFTAGKEPTEYFVEADTDPTIDQVDKVLELGLETTAGIVTIYPIKIVKM